MGLSQVSMATKMVNATWIACRLQWCFSLIGVTNSVQPYCRLEIITMQTTPRTSWTQRSIFRRTRGASAGKGGSTFAAMRAS
jgi:hypothetical protein